MSETTATHWLWPALSATLPWPLGMRVLAKFASHPGVRLPDEEAAWRQATRWGRTNLPETQGHPADEEQWRLAWRLTRLIDHADLFLALTRGTSAWLARHVDVIGAWPRRDPFLAVTNHWGAGMWALPSLRGAGHRARFLLRGIVESDVRQDRCLANYGKLRVAVSRRVLGTAMIYTGSASEEIARTWTGGMSVIGLFDVPPEPGRASISAEFGQGCIKVPLGLIRLAVEHRVPVITFAVGLDRLTGRRKLTIDPAQIWSEPADLAASLARHLDALLRSDSASWHMWPYAGELLGP